jgi:hypothetical protein
VLPGRFLAGEHPAANGPEFTAGRLGALLDAGLTVFVNLLPDREYPNYDSILKAEAARRGISVQQHRFGIADFGVPPPRQMQATLDALETALGQDQRVYLHCWAGVGRTGTTVGCFLVRLGLSGEEALAQLAAWWWAVPKSGLFPYSPETAEQAAYVRNWVEQA